MTVSFKNIQKGKKYSRQNLADLWGYKGYQALARGVVTPKNDECIILFVTEEKQSFQEQYKDKLLGNILQWEGPTDHFAEDRMINTNVSSDEIHLFYREFHHSDFIYLGRAVVQNHIKHSNKSSKFKLKII